MTYDDDFLQLVFDGGTKRATCRSLGIDWPPPERIEVGGIPMQRSRMSALTDDERAAMTHVCRGAEYLPETGNQRGGVH